MRWKTHKYIQCLLNLKYQRANSEIVQWNFRLLISSVCVCVHRSIIYIYIVISVWAIEWLFSLLFTTPTRTGDRHQDSCAVFEIPFVQFLGEKHLFSCAQSFLDTFLDSHRWPWQVPGKLVQFSSLRSMAKAKKTVNSQAQTYYNVFFLVFKLNNYEMQ